jgi:hypothetical protein
MDIKFRRKSHLFMACGSTRSRTRRNLCTEHGQHPQLGNRADTFYLRAGLIWLADRADSGTKPGLAR